MGLLCILAQSMDSKLNGIGMQGHSPRTQKHSTRKVLLFAANIEQFYFYINHWSSINFFATVTAIKSTTQNKHTQKLSCRFAFGLASRFAHARGVAELAS